MTSIEIVMISLGAVFAAAGIFLFARMGTGGENTIKIFGAEFRLAGSALVIFVLGCVLIILAPSSDQPPEPTVSPPVSAPPAQAPSTAGTGLVGTYRYTGRDLEGRAYGGQLKISAHGPVYRLVWSGYDGVGILHGDVLSVGWGGKPCNVVSYQIQPDGGLYGWWTLVGSTSLGSERASRLTAGSGEDIAGTYAVAGRNPDATPYRGTLTVSPSGSVYRFDWTIGTQRLLEGVGIRQGDIVSVGWGARTCGVASYHVEPDGSLSGTWGMFGSDRTGVEQALPQ